MANEMQSDFEVIQVCERLYARNMLAAADGNVSVRLDDRTILMTPSGVSKAFMKPGELVRMGLDGSVGEVSRQPSSERLMHLAIYQACSAARAVVHAHPPVATAWSIAHPHLTELPCDAMSELILAVGRVPIVPYARPGTAQMGEVLASFLPECRVMILARHGAIAWGETLEEALFGMERLEHAATILSAAHQLGGVTALPPVEVEALREIRRQMGPMTR